MGTKVAFIVPTPAHDVGPCCARLMAGATGQARGVVVPDLHPEAMHPTVPHLVPVQLDNAPVRRVLTEDTRRWGRQRIGSPGQFCTRVWWGTSGGNHVHHHKLYVCQRLRQLGIFCNEAVDGQILLDGRVGKIVK